MKRVHFYIYVLDGRGNIEVSQETFKEAICEAEMQMFSWEHMIPIEKKNKYSVIRRYWVQDENEKVLHKVAYVVEEKINNETASE